MAAPASNVSPSGTFDTAANVIATFDSARQAEGCTAPLSIDQTSFNSASSQQQMLMLFNAERQDRGGPGLDDFLSGLLVAFRERCDGFIDRSLRGNVLEEQKEEMDHFRWTPARRRPCR